MLGIDWQMVSLLGVMVPLVASALSPPQPRRPPRPTPADRKAAQRISAHGRTANWRAALAELRSLEDANAVHFNAAIDACGKSGRWEEALSLLREMASMPSPSMRPDAFSFSSTISAQSKAPDGWRRALALLRAMRMHGLEPSRYCYNAAITVCGSGGEWRRALQLLSAMEDRPNPPPDVYSFNTAIAACGRAGQWVAALELLERATSLGVCDVVTFSSAMGALRNSGRWEQALEVLGRMDAAGVQPNRVAYASAISACATGGQWVLAIKLLDDMREVGVSPDVRHCAAAIAACDKGGAWEMALKLLLRMDGRGVPPNTVAYNSAISACARAAQWRAALALLERMTPAPSPSPGGRGVGRGGGQGAGQGGGQGAVANTVSYNSAISACGRGGAWEAALRLATSMEGGGVRPDAITHNSVLDALARAAQWRAALRYLHSLLRRGGRGDRGAAAPDAVALCTAIAACEAAGAWRASRDLLWDGKIRAGPGEGAAGGEGESGDEGGEGGSGGESGGGGGDESVTVGSAAFALGGEADAVKAAEAVDELRAAFAAEAATGRLGAAYAAGVRACARAAQLRSGVLLLLQAEALQGGSLDASAYAALRDAAAAAGELELSRRMQRQRRSVGSADAEGALPPGPRAGATPLASFELENALVACANGFNASSASDVFLAVRPEGVAAVDAAREARDMVAQLRRARVNGYAPRLAALPAHVARGRSVQWQRTILAQHCEKKALAAQLALDYPAPALRTTHRMCIDCHDVFRAASLAYNRTVTCQDPGHLHVFKRGRCSCGGRWRGQPAAAVERTRWRGSKEGVEEA